MPATENNKDNRPEEIIFSEEVKKQEPHKF
jgi:hypothetical protein